MSHLSNVDAERSPGNVKFGKKPFATRDSASLTSINDILGILEREDDFQAFRQAILPGSCHWIVQKKAFRDWIEPTDTSSTIFWLTGPPAIGKTMLSSFIIDYLSRGYALGSCQYHFFQAERHDTRTISYCLRILALQIADKYEIFRAKLFATHQETGILFATKNYQVIWEKIFEGVLFRLSLDEPLFWVLDGLDEAESPAALASLLTRINSTSPIKVLLVSRSTKDISAALTVENSFVQHEEIEISDTTEDIHSYVSKAIGTIFPDGNDGMTIVDRVLSKASGSFLWVKLALERIKESWHTADDIQIALDEIPAGMEYMYERMAEIVSRQEPARTRELAIDILTWASCTFRPLDIKELAVALKPKFGTFTNLEVTISQICGNFIVIKNSKVTLIHQTGRKLLLANNPHLSLAIDSRKGHEYIATVCINYLSDMKWKSKFSMMQDTEFSDTKGPNSPLSHEELNEPFLWYSSTYWAYHVSCSTESESSEELQAAV